MRFIFILVVTLAIACLLPISSQARDTKETVIVIFGASLATGYRLPTSQGLVSKLQAALDNRGVHAKLINRSRNGRTMEQGAKSIGFALSLNPDGVVVALGGNDLRRREPMQQTEASLNQILSALKARGVQVLITTIDPVARSPNFRSVYNQIFEDASLRYDTLLLTDFYQPLRRRQDRKLSDGIHPNATGVDALVAKLLPKTIDLIKRIKK